MKLFQNFFGPKWKNTNPSIRKQAIIALEKENNQVIFNEILLTDDSPELRLLALKRITDFDVISQIAKSHSDTRLKEFAHKLVLQTLAGEKSSDLDEQEKISKIQQFDEQKLFEYVAENGNSVPLRKSAIEKISREAILGNLAISDANSEIRLLAAQKISQGSTLDRVYRATKTKDKNVSRIVRDKLNQLTIEAEKPAKLLIAQKELCQSIEKLGNKGLWQRDKLQFDHFLQQWAELQSQEMVGNENLELQSRFDKAKENFTQSFDNYLLRNQERLEQEAAYLPAKEAKRSIIANLHAIIHQLENNTDLQESELSSFIQSCTESEENWQRLLTLPDDIEEDIRSNFENALSTIRSNVKQRLHNAAVNNALEKLQLDITFHIQNPFKLSDKTIKKFEELWAKLTTTNKNPYDSQLNQQIKKQLQQAKNLLTQQETHIENLKNSVKTHLADMEDHLNKGLLTEALSIRKTIKNNLKELEKNGIKNLHTLKNRLIDSSNKINELSNWRSWANTPQKTQLIQKIEALIDSDIDPKEIAYLISQARNEWKKLGPSEKDSSQQLWEQFQTACEKAYEPCKSFFADESEIMADNYQKRIEFLNTLETFLNQANWDNIDWKKVETLFRHARQEWQELGITDKKKRKHLNKRFYVSYNKLKTALNSMWDTNAELKLAIVKEAQVLNDNDDLNSAINGAKTLQNRWKKAGRIQHTKERELWFQFKTACDAVFAKRENLQKEKEVEAQQHIDNKNKTVSAIETFCHQSIEKIAENKPILQQLRSEYTTLNTTNPDNDTIFEKRVSAALQLYERKLESLEKLNVISDLSRLKEKSEICSQLELEIESEKSLDINRLTDEMSGIRSLKQSDWSQRINQRLELLLHLSQQENSALLLHQAAEKNIDDKKLATVQLEIIADIDTPTEAADARLKAQAQRLSDKLQNHTEESHWDSFLSTEVNWLTIGPILTKDLVSLNQRHDLAITALKKIYPDELKNY